MSLRLYLDHHVPAAIAAGLRLRGADVLTAHEDAAEQIDDEQLLERATRLGRVLFSQDSDLLVIAHRRLRARGTFSGLIYAHQLGITIGKAVRDLELISRSLEPARIQDRVEFLPL